MGAILNREVDILEVLGGGGALGLNIIAFLDGNKKI